jgi:hypothetical protein
MAGRPRAVVVSAGGAKKQQAGFQFPGDHPRFTSIPQFAESDAL